MAKTRPPYTPEFRRQMVELVHAGRSPEELAQSLNRQRSRSTGSARPTATPGGARPHALPAGFVAPCLPTAAPQPPSTMMQEVKDAGPVSTLSQSA